MIKKLFTTFFLIITLFLVTKQAALAQEVSQGLDLTVNPSVIDVTNNPDTTIQGKFRIRNNTETSIPLSLSISKLLPNGTYDSVQPVAASPQDEFIKWIHFDQATISALPKEWTTVNYTITIPKDAAFGYYYGIRISQITKTDLHASGSKVQGEVLIPLLLNVRKDGAVAKANIIDFKTMNFFNEYLPILFTVRVSNTGNIHVKPRGNIFVHTGGENDMATLDVNETQGNILPGGTRTFTASWDDGFITREPVMEDGEIQLDKNKQPITHLVINWNNLTHFRIGKYTANLLLIYDNGKQDVPLEATTTFWVFPYTIIGVAAVSIIAIILLIRFLIKLAIKRELKKYKQ